MTIFLQVSSLYKDKSLKADINIVLAGLVFLNGNEVCSPHPHPLPCIFTVSWSMFSQIWTYVWFLLSFA